MAGSYNHCVADDGQLLVNEDLIQMVENLGDAYEAIEEMYGMIWLLAASWAASDDLEVYMATSMGAKDRSVEITPAQVVEYARERYKEGLEASPGTDGVLEDDDAGAEHDG